jgi:hypothetical protein
MGFTRCFQCGKNFSDRMELCPFCKFPLHRNVSESDEDAIYAKALSELKSGAARPGLWAKAFAESDGDENKSQALYIKLRVQQERERRQQEQKDASALRQTPHFFQPISVSRENAATRDGSKPEKLKETPSIEESRFRATGSDDAVPSPRKPVSVHLWKEISFLRVTFFITVLPAIIILLDIILSITFSKLSREIAQSEWRTIAYIFYFSLGIWISDYIYRLQKLTLIIVLSFIALFLYRFLISVIINPELIDRAMINTLEEGIIVYGALSLFSFFFRYFDPRFDYAEVKNVIEFTDPITKKKYDRGTCSKCGGTTIVGKERAISFLGIGKSSEYFCDNCNRFLRGNPLNNIFLGLTEAVSSLLFIFAVGSNMKGKTSSYSSIFLLLLLIGIYDGIKRLSFGISGVKRSYKKYNIL